jgi:Uma2 family endonuclease
MLSLFFLRGVSLYTVIRYASPEDAHTAETQTPLADVSVMRTDRLPDGKAPEGFVEGAPDLAVEVVLPSERLSDLLAKMADYFESGAQEVWLLFPERKQVYRYRADLTVEVLHGERHPARRTAAT